MAPSMTMFLLAMTGFEGQLVQQSQETGELMISYLMAGTGASFAAAFVLSLGVRLRRADVDHAQSQLVEGTTIA